MAEIPPPASDGTDGTVTFWLGLLKSGEATAVKPLWDAYFTRLVTLARSRLQSTRRAAADEEDVALAAFDSFCRGVEQGRFPQLDDRSDLWQVLFLLTTRKAIGLIRHENREKRGGTRIGEVDVDGLRGVEPTPEEVAEVAEECARLLACLGPGFRDVAVWKMEGYTNAEIAAKLGRSVPTVERKLSAIREIWQRQTK